MLGKEIKSMLNSVHEEAWNGLIPTEFSMDVSEVTSLQRPLPLYVSSVVTFLQRAADVTSLNSVEVPRNLLLDLFRQ